MEIKETTGLTGNPEILIRLDYGEAMDYLSTPRIRKEDDERIHLNELGLELVFDPLQYYAEHRLPGGVPMEEDYLVFLFRLKAVDREGFLEVVDRAAKIATAEVMKWDTVDVFRLLEVLTVLNDIAGWAGRKGKDYVPMTDLPSAPIPDDIDTFFPVWAVDRRGLALVGAGADEVMSLEEIRDIQERD